MDRRRLIKAPIHQDQGRFLFFFSFLFFFGLFWLFWLWLLLHPSIPLSAAAIFGPGELDLPHRMKTKKKNKKKTNKTTKKRTNQRETEAQRKPR